jgi:gluconate 2-dehydrogenase gamma chain
MPIWGSRKIDSCHFPLTLSALRHKFADDLGASGIMAFDSSRRGFLANTLMGVSGVWLTAHWPALLAAAEHARHQAKSEGPNKFEFFTPAEAAEVDAITARIIPTTDTPGAREAGIVFFIDRALVTFDVESQKVYREGLLELQARVRQIFPTVQKFSAATPDQQDKVLQSLDEQPPTGRRRGMRNRPTSQPFFETIRVHTIAGFLIDPESDKRGNRDGVGWKVIGRDGDHVFQPPFGYYDKDYPGWQPNPSDEAKSK